MQNRDSGLYCLVRIAEHFGIPADIHQLERAYILDKSGLDTTALLGAAGDLRLKSRVFENITIARLIKMPLPAMVFLTNGNYVLVLQADAQKLEIYDPLSSQQQFIAASEIFRKNWTGTVILFAKRFQMKQELKKFGFAWFLPIISKYKSFLLQVLAISLVLQIFGLLSPLFMQMVIDKVLVHRSLNTLDILLGGMILVALFENWMLALRSYLFVNTTNKIDVTLSSHMFKKITELPIRYFDRWQVGDIVSRAGELESIRSFMTGSALTVVLDIIFAVVYLTMMFVYSSSLSYVVWFTIPLYILLNVLVAPAYKRLINERFLLASENQSFTIETITGIRTLKAMGIEGTFVGRYEEILSRYVKSVLSVLNLANVANCIGTFIQQAFNLAILWIGAYNVMDQKLTVGELIAFQMLAGQVIAPVMRLLNMWQYFQQVRVSMDRLADIMDEKSEPAFNPNRTTLPSLSGEVLFDNVNFRYKADSKNVLSDISIRIPAGLKVGIVGRSGSGKSTLTKLVQRLYVPDGGRVMIDGVDIAQVEAAWLRRQIGVVLQDSFLFGGTIRENIAIAKPNASDEEIMAVARLAGVDEFVQLMPHKYETFVGERGSLLSGGQKQRVSIARALILDPKILIFDEATSALDSESEKLIMDHIDEIAAGRTVIMIAHRLSTVRHCDMIIAMDRGRIMECGSHGELMKHQGYYCHLYSSQE